MDSRPVPTAPGLRRARTVGLAVLTAAVVLAAAFALLPLAVRGSVRAIVLLLDACIWCAMSLSAGTSAGGLLQAVGKATASALITGPGSAVLAVLVLVAAAALYGLQRLLASKEEP
jgi:hypothetical protein